MDSKGVQLEGDWGAVQLPLMQLATADFAGVNAEIGEHLHGKAIDRLRNGTGADGKPFAPRKPARKGERRGSKTLVKSGRLRSSIHVDSDEDRAVVGTNLVYARAHQLGYDPSKHGGRGRAKLPARPYLGIDADDRTAIGDIVSDFVEELANP